MCIYIFRTDKISNPQSEVRREAEHAGMWEASGKVTGRQVGNNKCVLLLPLGDDARRR